MNRLKLMPILIGFILAFFIISGYGEKAFSGRSGPRSVPLQGRYIDQVPNFNPPPRPSIFLTYKWSPEDVIKALSKNGLKIKKTGPVTDSDYSSLPARAKEDIRFTVSSIGDYARGCVMSFEMKANMNKVKNHYRELNRKEELYSWSFVKDNVLLVLAGEIPEGKARLFESVLNNLQ